MPLYEYHCLSCDLIFEEIGALSDAAKKKPCPECARKAPRTVSAFAIASGGGGHHDAGAAPVNTTPRDSRPLCMRYSGIPLSCHMDEPSLKRFVAHAKGRGAEYDDKMATAAEVRKQRGIPEPTYAPPSHGHDHDHGRSHSHDRNPRRHAITQTNGHGHDHGHSHGHGKKKEKTSHTHVHGTHAH
jgi:putative FmdB family regulatory protein